MHGFFIAVSLPTALAGISIHVGAPVFAGALVGLALGLTGGGGALFAVPLLVYWIGVDPQTAVGVSLVTVTVTAAVGALGRWVRGDVEIRTGLLFAVSGMLAAPVGGWLGGRLPPRALLAAFGVVMLVIAIRMWRGAAEGDEKRTTGAGTRPRPTCGRDSEGRLRMTTPCFALLTLAGLAVGLLSGLFGVGGGFLIVPALVAFATMGLQRAVGTSLMVMTLVGAAAIGSKVAAGGAFPPDIVAGFVAGSVPALLAGSLAARRLPSAALARGFAVAIVAVAVFMIARTVAS